MLNPPFNEPRQLKLALNLPANVPGQSELETMCESSRRVDALCRFLGLGLVDELEFLLEALPDVTELGYHNLEYDPDVHGYIWDL